MVGQPCPVWSGLRVAALVSFALLVLMTPALGSQQELSRSDPEPVVAPLPPVESGGTDEPPVVGGPSSTSPESQAPGARFGFLAPVDQPEEAPVSPDPGFGPQPVHPEPSDGPEAQATGGAIVSFGPVGAGSSEGDVPEIPNGIFQGTAARVWMEQLLNAIRIDTPRPTVHGRNLFHLSIAMWDAWAAYDPDVPGYLVNETATAVDIEAARREAISYAAYRVLHHRFQSGPGFPASIQSFDQQLNFLGYFFFETGTEGDTPSAVGNRIGAAVIEFGLTDGANELNDYADDSGYMQVNPTMIFALPGTTGMVDPNRWQPLAFDYLITQNGIELGPTVQSFLGPNWGQVTPFCLTPEDMSVPYVYLDPGMPPQLNGVGDQQFRDETVENIRYSSWVDPTDGVEIDISPGAFHNNPLGTQDGTGYDVNPVTGEPYAPNVVKRADYVRVLAEFWADGPDSETPPGHWNTLANYVADYPGFEKRIGGVGEIVNDLEWDVKVYLALNGAVHDAAVAAWGAKGYYDYSRPISHIRYMAEKGQSSDPTLPSYDPEGLPLIPGLIELITTESIQPGQNHNHLFLYRGEIAIRAWQGNPADPLTQFGGVGWIRALKWLPYQRDTFVTPPFAGYVSGHSTFSRAAAEVLTGITGSKYFPGGLGTFVAPKDFFLAFEIGPTETVELQWATYYDAADEAGISRLYGGIHPAADDFPGRILGSQIGMKAWAKAQEYIVDPDADGDGVLDVDDSDPQDPNVCRDADGDTCDDCSSGMDDPSNDGADFDSDGACDAGDSDDDNDGVDDGDDSDPADANVCRDVDGDTCDDCTSGSDDPSSDGVDLDNDGLCDAGDPDDDNDGVNDDSDSDPTDANVCRDADADSCDDCSSGADAPSNDGTDTDSDGLCDLGDPDDDGDGVADGADSDPLNPNVCRDADGDTCDDCTGGTDDPSNDGPDQDGDGICDAGDSDTGDDDDEDGDDESSDTGDDDDEGSDTGDDDEDSDDEDGDHGSGEDNDSGDHGAGGKSLAGYGGAARDGLLALDFRSPAARRGERAERPDR